MCQEEDSTNIYEQTFWRSLKTVKKIHQMLLTVQMNKPTTLKTEGHHDADVFVTIPHPPVPPLS